MFNKRNTKIIEFENVTPSVTTNKMYMEGGVLKFAGSPVGSGSLTPGTVTNSTLRWNGAAWVEATNYLNDGTATSVLELNSTRAKLAYTGGSFNNSVRLENTGDTYIEMIDSVSNSTNVIRLKPTSALGIEIKSQDLASTTLSTITTTATTNDARIILLADTGVSYSAKLDLHSTNLSGTAKLQLNNLDILSATADAGTGTTILSVALASSAGVKLANNRLSISQNIKGTGDEAIVVGNGTYTSHNSTTSGAIITSQNSTYNTGVTNSCIIGGSTVTASKSSTVYMKAGRVNNIITNAAATYTMLSSDYTIVTTAASTITLIATPETGRIITIKKIANPAVTINPAAGNIDGSASYNLSGSYASVTLIYSGTEWNII